MTDELLLALRPLVERLRGVLDSRPDLRAEVAAVARAVAAWADAAAPAPPPVPEAPVPAAVPPPPAAPVAVPEPPPPLPPPAVAAPPVQPAPPRKLYKDPVRDPLPVPPEAIEYNGFRTHAQPPEVIAARCRIKADLAALHATARPGPAYDDALAEIEARALGQPDCALWFLAPEGYPLAAGVWKDLAAAYRAAAAAADLIRAWRSLPDDDRWRQQRTVLHAAAEAQSVLWSNVERIGARDRDQDQFELYITLREEGRTRSEFIHRYMKESDKAAPATAADVAARVEQAARQLLKAAAGVKVHKKKLDNLQYKLRKVAADPAGHADEWPLIFQLADSLVEDGLPPSSLEFRELLLPMLDRVPLDVPTPNRVRLVFREIDAYLASRPAEDEPEDDAPSAAVAEVAKLLAGRQLVLIGGQVRPEHKARLVKSFRLADLDWIQTPEHESYTVFEPSVARPETAVVLLAIRWTSHSYAEVQKYCTFWKKPLVRLPGGYNPNQVAYQILNQAGERLRG